MCFLKSLNIKYYIIVSPDINYIAKVLNNFTSTFFYIYNKNDFVMYELICTSNYKLKFLVDNIYYLNNSYSYLIFGMVSFNWLRKNLYK